MLATSIIGSVCLLISIIIFVNLIKSMHKINTNPKIYSGKIFFENKDDLIKFKKAIAAKEVWITNCEELSSDYPMLVSFAVSVPYDVEFGYGEFYQASNINDFGYIMGFCLFTFGILIIIIPFFTY